MNIRRDICIAFKIRNKIIDKSDDLLSTKVSKYNSKLYIDCCQMCGSKESLDTHHIKFQELADENKFIDHVHQNDLSNLIILSVTLDIKINLLSSKNDLFFISVRKFS